MAITSFEDLMCHVGHSLVVVTYGKDTDVYNVAVECEDCNEVIIDFDNPEVDDDEKTDKECPRCGSTLYKETEIPEKYPYVCYVCDENFYEFESA